MNNTTYECVKEITVYDPNTKDPIVVEKNTRWRLTLFGTADSFQELRSGDVVIALPDELVERHFKKV